MFSSKDYADSQAWQRMKGINNAAKKIKKISIVVFICSVAQSPIGFTADQGNPDSLIGNSEAPAPLMLQISKLGDDNKSVALQPYTMKIGDDKLSFVEIEPGLVGVVVLSTGEKSYRNVLASHMSPYEIFYQLNDNPVRRVPDFLVAHHERLQAASQQEPIALDEIQAALSSSIMSVSAYNKGLHNANCSYAADKAGFDQYWQNLGVPWHWYYSGQADYKSSPSVNARWFVGHLCNYSTGSNKPKHRVWGSGWYISQSVPKGKRSIIRISSNTRYNLRSTRYSDYYTENGWYRLGAMAK